MSVEHVSAIRDQNYSNANLASWTKYKTINNYSLIISRTVSPKDLTTPKGGIKRFICVITKSNTDKYDRSQESALILTKN